MALAGLRDVSLMSDPPEGRRPVETVIQEYSESVIEQTIRREVDRGGQVYFLHNRVETMEEAAAKLERLVPGCRIRMAHGQMDEQVLEDTMADFYSAQFDVLVCTTIIESGVDIPNSNTLIVDDADQLGLAQLYQLRGRVGRSDRQAYALFLYRDGGALTEIARQRLAALREFSELGAGQKIALRDLELRGAGSLLGLEQSGPVAAVGLDLYLTLLERAMRRIRGEKAEAALLSLPPVDLPVTSGIPETYVRSERERLRLYDRMSSVRRDSEVNRVQTGLEEKYGPLPGPVETSLALLRLRIRCHGAGVREIVSEGGHVSLILRKGHLLPEALEAALRPATGETLDSVSEDRVVLNVSAPDSLERASAAVEALSRALAARRAERKQITGITRRRARKRPTAALMPG
jgi:transcription-repair coupling factor (superfamily II helicase)